MKNNQNSISTPESGQISLKSLVKNEYKPQTILFSVVFLRGKTIKTRIAREKNRIFILENH